MTNVVFLDTETTSMDPQVAEPWEFGLILRQPGWQEDMELIYQARPTRPDLANPKSLEIGGFLQRYAEPMQALRCTSTGYAPAQPGGDPCTYAALARDLVSITHGAIIVCAGEYDVTVVDRFCRDHFCPLMHDYHVVEIRSLAAGYVAALRGKSADVYSGSLPLEPPWRVQSCALALGLNLDDYPKHTAMGDARMVRDMFDVITGRESE